MALILEVVLFALFLLALKIIRGYLRADSKRLPPGPKGLPLLGNTIQLIRAPHKQLAEWAVDHGNLYTINLAGKKAVVASDLPSMKALFGSLSSTGRFESELLNLVYQGKKGVGNAEGKVWQEQQRFATQCLKQLAFHSAKSNLDSQILRVCDQLCDSYQSAISQSGDNCNAIEDVGKFILESTGTLIWNMVTGKNLEATLDMQMTPYIVEWISALHNAAKSGIAFLPALKYFMPKRSGYTRYADACKNLINAVQFYFDQHRNLRIETCESQNLIHKYVEKINACTDTTSSFYGESGQGHAVASVLGIILGGVETTATTLHWLLTYLAVYPHVQIKLQQELDAAFGKDGEPSLDHKQKLAYLEAFVCESLRFSSMVPFGIIHKLMDPIQINDYWIPKDTLLIANIYRANHSKSVWKDPETFRPERFLEGDNNQRKSLRESLAAFQEGRRRCLGEFLARDMLLLLTARLVQKFRFRKEINYSDENYLTPNAGYFLVPRNLPLVITLR